MTSHYDFCVCEQYSFQGSCVIQGILAILPSIVLIYTGTKALREIFAETFDLDISPFTLVHLAKISGCMVLTMLYLIGIIVYVISKDVDNDVHAIYIVASLIQALNWCIVAWIIRQEYKKFCLTSNHIKLYFSVTATITFTLMIYIYKSAEQHDFRPIDILELVKLTILLILATATWLIKKDSPKAIDIKKLMDSYFSMKENKKLSFNYIAPNDFEQNFSEDNNNPTISSEILNKFMYFANKSNTFKRKMNISLQKDAENIKSRDQEYEIKYIKIPRWTEIKKGNKKTIVYVILYNLNDKILETKRSYAEFYKIFKKISAKYPLSVLPEFPEKKAKSEAVQEGILQERKLIFEEFLKLIVERGQYDNPYMKAFLESENEVEDFCAKIIELDSSVENSFNSNSGDYMPTYFYEQALYACERKQQ